METKLINCTPHPINIINQEGELILEIPVSGIIPRCSEIKQKVREIQIGKITLNVNYKKFGNVENLPEPELGITYIVSALVASACPNREDLLIPDETVRDEKGRIIGCKDFAIVYK